MKKDTFIIFAFIFSVRIMALPDVKGLQETLEKTLSPQKGNACKSQLPKQLTSIEKVSLGSCFSEYNQAKIQGTRVTLGDYRCEVPMDFVIYCSKKDWEKKDYQDIKVERVDMSFANTKSSAHIPPRGWTTEIVLEKQEEEATAGPDPMPLKISCYSGEKMMSLSDFQKIFEDTIRFK